MALCLHVVCTVQPFFWTWYLNIFKLALMFIEFGYQGSEVKVTVTDRANYCRNSRIYMLIITNFKHVERRIMRIHVIHVHVTCAYSKFNFNINMCVREWALDWPACSPELHLLKMWGALCSEKHNNKELKHSNTHEVLTTSWMLIYWNEPTE